MKLRFYVDIFNGQDPNKHPLYACTSPTEKQDNVTRVAFYVTIPDAVIFKFDAVAPEVSLAEVVVDHE